MSSQLVLTPSALRGLMPCEESVLRVLLYFNIFNHPLTAEEILSFLPSIGHSIDEITSRLHSGSLKRVVQSRGNYYFLHSAPATCIEDRMAKERLARRRMRAASLIARFIGFFPFVRGVMLSGELSKGVASRNSDIDFVVVTQRKRLWICRTALILFKKTFLFNSKKYFCLNHFVAEDNLPVELRNVYSAMEVATLKPLYNRRQFVDYIAANQWIGEYFPNRNLEAKETPCDSRAEIGAGPEKSRVLIVDLLDRIDYWLMNRWRLLWRRRYGHLSDAERHHKFHCDSSRSTAYGEDYQQKILTQYSHRLHQYGISGPEQRN